MADSITLKEYIRIEMRAVRDDVSDIKSDVKMLRDDFMTMEKGRLTKLEQEHIAFKATVKTYGTIFGFILIVVQLYLAYGR